ncbi:GNAT family N-acetyltransferase, partial [Kingella denitrificans]|uniref:GNAT family N-acetyltransferase n=1 Tax=Kingella denitrificans TaxID=502 RepID=UPI0039903C0F
MARLPIDPKVARILLAAQKHDCMAEILVIVSALSIQDPRERPLEAREAAAKAHERFADKQSDFLAYLNIWDSFQRERDKGLSNRQMVAWCHQYFLSHLRMREWRELHAQLAQIVIEMGLTDKESAFRRPEPDKNRAAQMSDTSIRPTSQSADLAARLKQKELAKKHARAERRAAKEASYEQIHRALLTGLIANVGMKSPDGNDYTGARGSRFHLFPASALFKSKPKWVMAAELTETTRLYARDVAAIQPEWIEQEAPHLVKYHYFEPHWEQKRGEVVASERVTLYGLTVLPRRPVAYGRIAPAEAREIFIRSALVAQEMGGFTAPFFVHNQKLIREVAELEHKSRRQDVLVDDEILFEFYDARLPKTVFKSGGEIVGQPENAVLPSENKAGWVATQQNAQKQPENRSDGLSGSLKPNIRPATTSDAAAVAELFLRAVQHISNRHYSEQEKNAWLQGADDADFWQKHIDGGNVRVATHNGRVLGFIEYQPEQSHLNCLYTDPHHQRQGIATALLNAVLPSADSGKTITVDASKAALAFFQKQGFVRQHENQIPRNGLVLTNYRMVRQAGSLKAQRQPENRSDDPKGSLKPQTPSEKPLADIRTFAAWLKTAERDNPRLLFLSR